MYQIKQGKNEYKTGTLYHCYVLSIDSLETLYKAYGSTSKNAKQRAIDFISQAEAMREGDAYKQADIEELIEGSHK